MANGPLVKPSSAGPRVKGSRYAPQVQAGLRPDAYVSQLENTFAALEASGQVAQFPAPVGVVVDWVSSRAGSAGGRIAMLSGSGEIFIAQGINGGIYRWTPRPGGAATLAELASSPMTARANGTLSRRLLPEGTLPGGLQWFPGSDPATAPDGEIDIQGARESGLGLGAILALVAAGYLALRG